MRRWHAPLHPMVERPFGVDMKIEHPIVRREFLFNTVATGAALLGVGQTRTTAEPDPTSARRTLDGHRLSQIQLKRSSDKYSHFVSQGATGGPTRYGFARDVCILETDQGRRVGPWPVRIRKRSPR